MKIYIEYESAWRNSFLDGSNNEPSKNVRKFVGSMKELKEPENYIKRSITKDTVMGVLNRLIGEQAKLYQARQRENYYFSEIESLLKDSDIVDKPVITNEVVYIRNISGSYDRNSFTGMVKANDPAFTSEYSSLLWSVLWLTQDALFDFISKDKFLLDSRAELNPLAICDRFEFINDKKNFKDLDVDKKVQAILDILNEHFPDVSYITQSEKVPVVNLFCSALYLQVKRLQRHYDLGEILTKKGNLSGISKRGFTKKNFMSRFVTGGEKLVWGGAYLKKERIKGEGEVVSVLTKASGKLTINLDIPRDQAIDLEDKISNAGVSSFYLGKKGLAYVTDIRI